MTIEYLYVREEAPGAFPFESERRLLELVVNLETAANLHQDAEHEASDVIAPFGVFRSLKLSAVILLRVSVGGRDTLAGAVDYRTLGVRLAANHDGRKAFLRVLSVGVQ